MHLNSDTDPRVEQLERDCERLQQELVRANQARDALVREVLPLGRPTSRPGTARRWFLVVVVLAVLLALSTMLVRKVLQLAKLRQVEGVEHARPQHSGVSRRNVDESALLNRGLPVGPRLRQSLVVTEVALLGRMARSANGAIAVAGNDGRVVLYRARAASKSTTVRAHRGPVSDVRFAEVKETRLVTAGSDGAVHIWDLSGAKVKTLRTAGESPVRRIASDGNWVAVASDSTELDLISLDAGSRRRLVGGAGQMRSVAISRNRQVVAGAGTSGLIYLWDVRSCTRGDCHNPTVVRPEHGQWINALAFSRDGAFLAEAGFDKKVRVWRVRDWSVSNTLEGHVRRCTDVLFSPNGTLLATASLDRTARIWDLERGRLRDRIDGARYQVNSVVFDAEADVVFTASADGLIRQYVVPLRVPKSQSALPAIASGELTLRTNTGGERQRVRLFDKRGQLVAAGVRKLAWLLRSGPDDRTIVPDEALVRLLYRVSDHFGREKEIRVISGYRSPEFNQLRTKQSTQVAKNSQHREGKAIDFRIDGVSIKKLHKYVKAFKAGGVGFYADSQFVHMDVGPVRYWEGN